MHSRPLTSADEPQYRSLLMLAPEHNPFHLSALTEYGIGHPPGSQGMPWAVGVFRDQELAGTLMALRGTGGIYHRLGDTETLYALAELVSNKASEGVLSLLSAHISQIGPLLPLIPGVYAGSADHCTFCTLYPQDLMLPTSPGQVRLARDADMERLIDFYATGFYSLANLPTRAAWRNRLSEQLAFRTLFFAEDDQGKVLSSALSSAEGGGAAMIGGVATRIEHRGKGLSGLCVGTLCEHLFANGANSVSLFYLTDNTPAARVYEKLGFREQGEWLLAPLGLAAPFGPLFGLRGR